MISQRFCEFQFTFHGIPQKVFNFCVPYPGKCSLSRVWYAESDWPEIQRSCNKTVTKMGIFADFLYCFYQSLSQYTMNRKWSLPLYCSLESDHFLCTVPLKVITSFVPYPWKWSLSAYHNLESAFSLVFVRYLHTCNTWKTSFDLKK